MQRFTTAVGLSLLLITGCASAPGAPKAAQPPPVAATPVIHRADQIRLPLDDYAFTDAENELVSQAYSRLIRRCATRFGVATAIPAPENASAAAMNVRRYGIIDGTFVNELGYGLRETATAEPSSDKRTWEPSKKEEIVLRGVVPEGAAVPTTADGRPLPPGGCLGETERALGGTPPIDPGASSLDSFTAAENDARVVKAFSAWSGCMSAHGFDYENPWEANDGGWPEPAGAEEIRTARQDLACRRQTNLVGIWHAVEAAYQAQLIADNRAPFEQLAAWRDERVAAARRTLDAG